MQKYYYYTDKAKLNKFTSMKIEYRPTFYLHVHLFQTSTNEQYLNESNQLNTGMILKESLV